MKFTVLTNGMRRVQGAVGDCKFSENFISTRCMPAPNFISSHFSRSNG